MCKNYEKGRRYSIPFGMLLAFRNVTGCRRGNFNVYLAYEMNRRGEPMDKLVLISRREV